MLFVRFRIFPLLSIGMKLWEKYETIMLLSKISHENCSDFTLIFSLFWTKKMKSLKIKDFGIIFFFLTSINMNHGPNFQKKVVSGPESFKKCYFFHKKGIFFIFWKYVERGSVIFQGLWILCFHQYLPMHKVFLSCYDISFEQWKTK